jgi:hypothetical protein
VGKVNYGKVVCLLMIARGVTNVVLLSLKDLAGINLFKSITRKKGIIPRRGNWIIISVPFVFLVVIKTAIVLKVKDKNYGLENGSRWLE